MRSNVSATNVFNHLNDFILVNVEFDIVQEELKK